MALREGTRSFFLHGQAHHGTDVLGEEVREGGREEGKEGEVREILNVGFLFENISYPPDLHFFPPFLPPSLSSLTSPYCSENSRSDMARTDLGSFINST